MQPSYTLIEDPFEAGRAAFDQVLFPLYHLDVHQDANAAIYGMWYVEQRLLGRCVPPMAIHEFGRGAADAYMRAAASRPRGV